jgi:hypothetical protein
MVEKIRKAARSIEPRKSKIKKLPSRLMAARVINMTVTSSFTINHTREIPSYEIVVTDNAYDDLVFIVFAMVKIQDPSKGGSDLKLTAQFSVSYIVESYSNSELLKLQRSAIMEELWSRAIIMWESVNSVTYAGLGALPVQPDLSKISGIDTPITKIPPKKTD